MAKIEVMSEYLSNRIAAGEVIERPASVVKELVENAIDAGSTRIEVMAEEGGLSRIKVIDNGQGMDRADASLAFARHATSKLKSDKELFQIMTLGFRGEALPSIASVSHVSLQSWDGKEEAGTEVYLEGGKVIRTTDAPLRQGTRIEVTNLFYNTPARYKYLKTIHTELSHITDYMNRLALAHPQIAFSLSHNGRELLSTNGKGDVLQVLAAIYGPSVAKQMLSFSAEHIDFDVAGYLGKPELTRSNRQYISIIINGRYLRNYAISQAVMRAYHTLLPVNRYPIALLSIKMEPSLIDINVHPAKLEARLSKEAELAEWLEKELKSTLHQAELIPSPLQQLKIKQPVVVQEKLDLRLPDSSWGRDYQKNLADQETDVEAQSKSRLGKYMDQASAVDKEDTRNEGSLYLKDGQKQGRTQNQVERQGVEGAQNLETLEKEAQSLNQAQYLGKRRESDKGQNPVEPEESDVDRAKYRDEPRESGLDEVQNPEESRNLNRQEFQDQSKKRNHDYTGNEQGLRNQELLNHIDLHNTKDLQEGFSSDVRKGKMAEHNVTGEKAKIPLLSPLGQLHGTYILAQNENGLYMVDQHAAQERIWYEHFYQKLNEPPKQNQELLIPIVLEFTAGEDALLAEHLSFLEQIGLTFEEFGHHSYMLRSHPTWFPEGEEEALIREIIDLITQQKKQLEWIYFREKVAIMMSCKQAIKANHYLTHGEMEALLEQLRTSSNPFTCPHGRPITVLLSTYDIEKMFKRVM